MESKMKLFITIFILLSFFNPLKAQNSFHTAKANAPKAGTIFIYPERIKLKGGGYTTVERGMMFVPINRSKRNSDVISVEIYRFKASDKADPSTPPIFYLHGGPSFAGLEGSLKRPGTYENRWKPMTDISDVIIVGQRGIGSSKPTTTVEVTTPAQPADSPYDYAKAKKEHQESLKQERKYWEDQGLDLKGFTIHEAAADVDDVRKALGYDKIVIWGGSFGSHWGMDIMRNYPEIVERAILRGMEGPDHTYDHPGHMWNAYKRVAADAEESEALKGLIPEGGLIKAVETIVARAKNNPFTVPIFDRKSGKTINVLIDGKSIQNFTRGLSRNLYNWPAEIITMYNGDYTSVARILNLRSRSDQIRTTTASYYMLDIGSGITPERLAEHNADPAMDIIGDISQGYKYATPMWDSDLGNEFRQNFETDIPTVIVQGTWDTSTPYENAVELVPYFKNSKFIPLKRGPHGAIQAALAINEQFKKSIFKFAATGDMSDLPDQMEIPLKKWKIPTKK